jgi:hypothetical protein
MIELSFRTPKEKVSKVRGLILSAGNKMANVWFIKRSNGKKRRMSFRLRVFKPQYAKVPNGKGNRKHRKMNQEKGLMTVFDVNCIRYDKRGRMNVRGSWKSIPLDGVIRIAVNGEIYRIR